MPGSGPAPDSEISKQRAAEAGQRARILQRLLQRARPLRRMPIWLRYVLATALVVLFFFIRLSLSSPLQPYPYLLFFPAIILVSFLFDRGSGFYATVLSATLSTQLQPSGVAQPLTNPSTWLAVAIFLVVGLFCATIIEALRLTVDELGESEESLQRYIAARAAAEAALAESELRFRTAFEAAGVGVAQVGLDGRWQRVNKRLCEMLGYSQNELLALTFQDITHPDDLEADLSLVRRLLAGEIGTYSMEKRYLRRDGSQLWIELTVALVRDPGSGDPQYFISVVSEIEARKAAEIVLSRDKELLSRLVEERTGQLMRANEEQRRAADALQQGEKLQALGQLTGGIAHDFNNLLQVVSSGAQLLKGGRLSPERREAVLDGLVSAAQNAKDLTGQLLAFARRQPLQPQTFDLNARLETMAETLGQTLGPAVTLQFELAPDLWPVRLDPVQLEVALLNLAVNARDAMPEGGTFTVQTRNVVVSATADGQFIDLTVKDTGAGMPPAILSRVFEPFFTTKGPGRGTGLGLAQVHGFAKQSGGEVALESMPGEGTTVILHLPRAPAGSDRPRAGEEPDLARLIVDAAGRSVLVVEDNDDVAEFACSMLRELGYQPERAKSGPDALDRLAAAPDACDIVFSDIVMPGMSGLELASTIRDRHPGVAVLLASGYSESLGDWEGELPAEVLGKPYQLLELGEALERSYRRSRSRT